MNVCSYTAFNNYKFIFIMIFVYLNIIYSKNWSKNIIVIDFVQVSSVKFSDDSGRYWSVSRMISLYILIMVVGCTYLDHYQICLIELPSASFVRKLLVNLFQYPVCIALS